MSTAKEVIEKWLSAFNAGETAALEALYTEDAVNHQMPLSPVEGRAAIGEMFRREFAAAPEMHCIPVQIISDGDRGVLEWRDPKGFRGCGFFDVENGKIRSQRGYWDRLRFKELYGIAD